MIGRSIAILALVALVPLALPNVVGAQSTATPAHEAGTPYAPSFPVDANVVHSSPRVLFTPNTNLPLFTPGTRIVLPLRMHREVEVSRSLAAQPVHPHLVKVVLGEDSARPLSDGGSGIVLSTYIDPLQKLHGPNGLDENHSLVKAQRLHLALTGTTSEQVNALSYRSYRAATEQLGGANRARIVVAPRRAAEPAPARPRPIMIIPKPEAAPVPHEDLAPNDGKLVAERDRELAGG